MQGYNLRPAQVSDQSMPCGMTHSERGHCPRKAQFRIYPACSHDREEWPDVQVCGSDLARAVGMASRRCVGHNNGGAVRVIPIGVRR